MSFNLFFFSKNYLHLMTDKGKSSPVWKFFSLKQDDVSKCHCLLSPSIISRGKPEKPKKFSTSSLLTHLHSKHAKQYEDMQTRMLEAKKKAETSAAQTIEYQVQQPRHP
jgi:hypothetical protein